MARLPIPIGYILTGAALAALALVAGCSESAEESQPLAASIVETPTVEAPTPVPTATPAPTATAVAPTEIPAPTATPKPAPTASAPVLIRRASTTEVDDAPDFELQTFDGESLLLSDLEGKVVVLNFWASWCPPCRWEMPSFERIYQEYKDDGVVFVGVAMSDTLEDAQGFADEAGVTYPIGLDTDNRIAIAYRVMSLPTTFFINKEGQVQRRLTSAANEGVLKVFLRGQMDAPVPSEN